MTTPGFDAEASLSNSGSRYRSAHIFTTAANQVVPQLPASCFRQAVINQVHCLQSGTPPLLCAVLFDLAVDNCTR